MAIEVRLKHLKRALRFGGRIDASAGPLETGGKPLVMSCLGDGAHHPPYLIDGERLDSVGDVESSRTGVLRVRDFEALSLKARVALTGPQRGDPKAPEIEALIDRFPVVHPGDILEALAWAADELGPDQGKEGSAKTAEQLAMRSGLQLIGLRIQNVGRDGLRLFNARLPLSLKLIGCVVEAPVLLSHAKLVSLDLSGSALNCLDASGLSTMGGVHLRRTYVRTPVSFAGARIGGSFDAADGLFTPFGFAFDETDQSPAECGAGPKGGLHPQAPLDADHGMLSLSKANVENEVRLQGARIWGGLSLRGARIGRSLFINGTVVVSPLAMLEKWAADTASRYARGATSALAKDPNRPLIAELKQLGRIDRSIAARMHRTVRGLRSGSIAAEILPKATQAWSGDAFKLLLMRSARTLTCAVRADGLTVEGSVFARGLTSLGRFRMKYATVMGAVRFEGAVLRAPARSRLVLEVATGIGWSRASPLVGGTWTRPLSPELLKRWLALIADTRMREDWSSERTETALDLRETRINGDLSIGDRPDDRPRDAPTTSARLSQAKAVLSFPRKRRMLAEIYGHADLSSMTIGGSIVLSGARFRPIAYGLTSPDAGGDCKGGSQTPGETSGSETRRSGNPAIRIIDRVTWRHEDTLPDDHTARWSAREKRLKIFTVNVAQSRIDGDLDLRASDGIHGLQLLDAEIGGSLMMATKSSGRTDPNYELKDRFMHGFVKCPDRATRVTGLLNLTNLTVKGDTNLVFDPETGPTVRAPMAAFEGRLDVYPQVGSLSYQLKAHAEDRKKHLEQGFWLDVCRHRPRRDKKGAVVCEDCGTRLDAIDDDLAAYIDLRNARATVFSHPPAAWPHPGALSLNGFHYERASDLGPLSPQPADLRQFRTAWARRRLQFLWRHHPLERGLVSVAGALVFTSLAVGLSFGLWALLGQALPALEWFSGAASIGFLSSAGLVMLIGAWALTFVGPGPRFPIPWVQGKRSRIRPLAIEYLARQRKSENRFKWRPSSYHALDSYVTAARALREAGRYISANRVEEQRLRLRTEMLSWRLHGPVKLALRLVGLLAGYGFRLSRAMVALCLLTIVIAHYANHAAESGLLVHGAREGVAIVPTPKPKAQRLPPLGPEINALKPVRSPSDAQPVPASPSLRPGLVYALDLLLPVVDFASTREWRPTRNARRLAHGNLVPWPPLQALQTDLRVAFRSSWPSLVEMLGVLLTAVLGGAIAARIQSALARVQE